MRSLLHNVSLLALLPRKGAMLKCLLKQEWEHYSMHTASPYRQTSACVVSRFSRVEEIGTQRVRNIVGGNHSDNLLGRFGGAEGISCPTEVVKARGTPDPPAPSMS